eukprot:TRINITY_DN9925_c0_g1_i1.p1 TRINITY_DN9925_c0_g1~~TRINITY_DN9925_c0_g1_i1.p1  ORF type:complete len:427 (+),score=45.90 TRINITY_DN9925_c0_g1_i1:79-1359(+)
MCSRISPSETFSDPNEIKCPSPTASSTCRISTTSAHSGSSSTTASSIPLPARTGEAYWSMGAPWGLAKMLADEDKYTALRVFILDNSGSTSKPDGHIIEQDGEGRFHVRSATRWQEICAMAMDQAKWNAMGGVRTEFHLVNPPCPQNEIEGRDYQVIDSRGPDVKAQLDRLGEFLEQNGPRGRSLISQRLQALRQRLLQDQDVTNGKRVMLSIVTDGLPTGGINTHFHYGNSHDQKSQDQSTDADKTCFIQELSTFAQSFNCFLVVRLVTAERNVHAFYNSVHNDLELPLNIVRDYLNEARKVHRSGNGWFTYTPLLHRVREGGCLQKILDVLNERPLVELEVCALMALLFQDPEHTACPQGPKQLLELAATVNATENLVFHPRLRQMAPPLNLSRLQAALGRTLSKRLLRAASSARTMFRDVKFL